MNTSRRRSQPPNSESEPEKTLFKWNWAQGETKEQFAARILAHLDQPAFKGLKPEPFQPPPQNPN